MEINAPPPQFRTPKLEDWGEREGVVSDIARDISTNQRHGHMLMGMRVGVAYEGSAQLMRYLLIY